MEDTDSLADIRSIQTPIAAVIPKSPIQSHSGHASQSTRRNWISTITSARIGSSPQASCVMPSVNPVSYTHLTLPTSDLV